MPEPSDWEIVRLGKVLIHGLLVVCRTAAHYPVGHPALKAPLEDLLATIRAILEQGGEAAIRLRERSVFLGERHLKPDAAGLEAFMFTVRVMEQASIGGITFTSAVSAADIEKTARLLGKREGAPSPDAFEEIAAGLRAGGVTGVELEMSVEEKDQDRLNRIQDGTERAKAVYARTIDAVSGVMEEARMGKSLALRKSKRVIHELVDSLMAAETSLLGLTNLRCHDEYTYNHSVNVCILALSIGHRAGLDKTSLADLGMTALFHDIGKTCIPMAILNKPSAFDDKEWGIMMKHPVLGVRELLRLKGVDFLSARIMTGAFEHHLQYDLSGYPNVPYPRRVSLFGSIVSIADCYDAVTSSRVYSRVPSPPEKALRFMLERSGTHYDPVLMKLFVNCIGLYPIGTLCLLQTGELAVVMENNRDAQRWNEPLVKVISDAEGNEIEGQLLDLANPRAQRRIVGILDGERYGIDVGRHFV